jgi:dipicolinate synthase subunit A
VISKKLRKEERMETQLNGIKIAVLGGDRRELEMLRSLTNIDAEIKTLGNPGDDISGIKVENELLKVVDDVDVIIAPMVSTNEEGYLKATFVNRSVKLGEDFFASLKPETLLFMGVARGEIPTYCQDYKINLVQLAKLEEVAILNAIPTAEGPIQIAMEESDITLHSNNC